MTAVSYPLTWHDDLNVGLDVMDEDHRALFVLLNRIHEDKVQEHGKAFVTLFAELVHHLEEHFGREDELMRRHGFFAYHCHHGEHEHVLERVRTLHDEAKAGQPEGAQLFLDREIVPWFIQHRNTMDLVTSRFLLGQLSG